MPFNGSGQFVRLYSWVQDAANGVNIDATRMDNEFNGVATALTDCVTRDGQSPFTANIPAGGFKITGLGTPTASTDAATKAYVDSNVSAEWLLEASGSLVWVSTTQFKVVGIDVTARYHAGRRVKITHNSGSTTVYAGVVSSSFSSDTTVTVATDDGSSLVSTVTAVSYGTLSYLNPSYLDPRSAVFAVPATPAQVITGTSAKLTLGSIVHDAQSEFSSSRFTAKHPGYYMIVGNLSFVASSGGDCTVTIEKNGSDELCKSQIIAAVNVNVQTTVASCVALLAKGDYIELFGAAANSLTVISSGGGSAPFQTNLSIARIA